MAGGIVKDLMTFFRILSKGLENKVRGSWKLIAPLLRATFFNMQSVARSRMIADRHYNLDNEMFLSFLDNYNQYSCGYFMGCEDLGQAQINKMRWGF
jgi:cyclopropane-fatty-acyl-phospholipid synthase